MRSTSRGSRDQLVAVAVLDRDVAGVTIAWRVLESWPPPSR